MNVRYLLTVVLLLLASGRVSEAQNPFEIVPQSVGVVESVSYSNPAVEPTESDLTRIWSLPINRPGSSYLRLRVTVNSVPPNSTSRLQVGTNSIVNAYSKDIDIGVVGKSFWTPPILGQTLAVSLLAERNLVGLSVTVDRVAYTTRPGRLSSIVGLDQREEVFVYSLDPVISRVERAIAKLSFVKDQKMYVCTGFLVDDSHLVTNEHCVNTDELCASTAAIFGYQKTPDGSVDRGTSYECEKLVDVSFELDYAVLKLRGTPGQQWGQVRTSDADVVANDPLFIIQHPAGEQKQVSIKECSAAVAVADGRGTGTDFSHTCDTLGGSSGSPVFNASGFVVGLHHFGVGGGGFWNENRAVRMSRVMESSDVMD